jgi:hypothetical protein
MSDTRFCFWELTKRGKNLRPPPKQTADLNIEICYKYFTSSYAKSASNPLRLGVTLPTKNNGRETYTKWTTQRDQTSGEKTLFLILLPIQKRS